MTAKDTDTVREALRVRLLTIAGINPERSAVHEQEAIALALGLIAVKLCDAIPDGELNVNAWDMGKP